MKGSALQRDRASRAPSGDSPGTCKCLFLHNSPPTRDRALAAGREHHASTPPQPAQPQGQVAPYTRLKESGRILPKARLKQGIQPRQVTRLEDLTHQVPQMLQRRGGCSPSQISLPSYTDGRVRRNSSTERDFNKAAQTGPIKAQHADVHTARLRNSCSYAGLKSLCSLR